MSDRPKRRSPSWPTRSAGACTRRIVEAKLAHLHDVLFDVVGFAGNVDDYYNPANSYLPDVLRTHRGLPITLVLIYKCVAEGVGLTVRGINSPGHFLAAVQMRRSCRARPIRPVTWMYVDPFYGGGLLDRDDVCRRIAETTGRDDPPLARSGSRRPRIANGSARMLNNLQAVFAHTGRERDLYAMQELQELLTKRVLKAGDAKYLPRSVVQCRLPSIESQ